MSASVNYRTDFKIFEVPAEGAEYTFSVPFRFSYYTTGATVFVASHCNGEYNNCELLEDGRLKVTFDNHGLAPGRVLCRREFYLTDEDYNDGICNAVFDTTTDIFLTLSGSDLGDITVELPPFYQKGDPFKWEDMTAEQREYFIEQVGADVVATNEAVIAAEAQRVIAENKRSERFESVMQEATTQAGYAKEQGDYAKAQGEYARNWAEIAVDSALQAQQATSNIEKTSQSIKEAEAQRVLAEQEREKSWNNLKSEANSSISETKASSSNANKAALSASTAATNANNAIEEMQQSFDGKVAEVDTQVSEKIAAADAATERANTAAGNADAAREAIQEDLGRKANTDGTYSKMTVGFAENIVGEGRNDFMPATPSGDPMHYAYVDAGAVWNNTTGYWELNGLTDITTAQMRTIYNETSWMKTLSIQAGCMAYSKSRTNIVTNFPYTLTSETRIPLNNAFRGCNAEKIVLWDDTTIALNIVLHVGAFQAAFYGCAKLKSIHCVFDLSTMQYSTDVNYAFHNSTKLERVKLKGCKFNINLSTLSVLSVESAIYLIANASTTEAFTVTFNANRQGIYEADSAFIEAKNAHPNVTINYL